MIHRRRRRIRRYGTGRLTGRQAAAALLCGGLLAVAAHHAGGTPAGQARASVVTTAAAATAITYARQQLGKPYLWGGVGPDAFDCSGLTLMSWRAAGVSIARTSQAQWATEPRVPVSRVQPGDLVFFAGSDGTAADPGHVGLVVDPARHLMIEAYATGYPVRYSQFGTPGSPPGDQVPAGYTDPSAHGGT